jgi:hypothetical protein
LQLIVADIVLFILGKAVNEKRPVLHPEQDDRPETARLPLPLPGDALLYDTTAKIGIDQAPCRRVNRRAQNGVRDPRFSGKPRK